MKTIRLLYPDYVSGGLDSYYFGANLLQHILPPNDKQKLVRVNIEPPSEKQRTVQNGILACNEVVAGIRSAATIVERELPDRIITIGGNCIVSLVPFDYLHGRYEDIGIIWIDAHPDVSTPADGYPNAHAMVLGTLLGGGSEVLRSEMKNKAFRPDQLLYVGLQGLHDYQQAFLDKMHVDYHVQDQAILPNEAIEVFAKRFQHVLVHFDIDALDEHLFHSTYFANPELVGDGSGGGRMTIDQVGSTLRLIESSTSIVGLTIAEYLPFDEERLHKMLGSINIFKD